MVGLPQIPEAAGNFGVKINEHSENGIINGKKCDIVRLPQIPEAAAHFGMKRNNHTMVTYMVDNATWHQLRK